MEISEEPVDPHEIAKRQELLHQRFGQVVLASCFSRHHLSF